ncbi:MAG TPA: hypothetical protein VIK93_06075 [Limnochordales bacterium]
MQEYHAEDVIPFALTLIVAAILVLVASGSLQAVTLAEQCGPKAYESVLDTVDGILAREGTAYRVDTAAGGAVLAQDGRLTRVQLRHVLNSRIDPCVTHLGPSEGWRWQALHDRVTAEIRRREQVSGF